MLNARLGHGAQFDIAIKAEGRDGQVPVPAEMALGLPQHVGIGNGAIIGGIGDEKGLFALLLRSRFHIGMKNNPDFIFPSFERM